MCESEYAHAEELRLHGAAFRLFSPSGRSVKPLSTRLSCFLASGRLLRDELGGGARNPSPQREMDESSTDVQPFAAPSDGGRQKLACAILGHGRVHQEMNERENSLWVAGRERDGSCKPLKCARLAGC